MTSFFPFRRAFFWLICLVLLFLFLHAVKAILLPFVVGIGLAYMLDPAADRLERAGLSRGLATTVLMAGFFSVVGILLSWLMPVLYEQTAELMTTLPGYVEQARQMLGLQMQKLLGQLEPQQAAKATQTLSDLSQEALQSAAALMAGVLKSGGALLNLLSLLVLMPVVSFYLLRDWDRIITAGRRLFPRAHAHVIEQQLHLVDQTLAGFMRGTLNVMLVLGSFYAIALSLAGLKFALLIGLAGGILILIPYLGTIITGASAIGIAYMQQQGLEHVVMVAGIFIIGQVLEGYVLTPRLVGERVGLHPLWLIFGMLCGATLFGFVGVLLAVPVTAVVGVLVRFAITRYLESDYYSDTPPDTTSPSEPVTSRRKP